MAAWQRHYHDERPHSSLGNQTPGEFVAGLPFAPQEFDTAEPPPAQGNPAGELTLGLDPPAVPQSEAEI